RAVRKTAAPSSTMISAKTAANQRVSRHLARPNTSISECVANAANCANQAWALAVHLTAKIRHVHVHKVGVRGVVVAPAGVEVRHAGDEAALVATGELRQPEF